MTDVTATSVSAPSNPSAASDSVLANRDFTFLIDKSGSMSYDDVKGYKSRWHAVQESTRAMARKVDLYDPDGATLYVFAGGFRRYDNVTPQRVDQVFVENEPGGGTNLHLVLADAFKNWEQRKKNGELKSGETMVVITDGEPSDEEAVAKELVRVSKKMDQPDELKVILFQVGPDPGARSYLKRLDEGLVNEGAKFDIVETNTFDELENTSITEAFVDAHRKN